MIITSVWTVLERVWHSPPCTYLATSVVSLNNSKLQFSTHTWRACHCESRSGKYPCILGIAPSMDSVRHCHSSSCSAVVGTLAPQSSRPLISELCNMFSVNPLLSHWRSTTFLCTLREQWYHYLAWTAYAEQVLIDVTP